MLDAIRMLRFAAVGLVNTALGYGVILPLLALGADDILSNALGYGAGLILGFVLNSRWTFKAKARFQPSVLLRYILTFAAAYGANLAVVLAALSHGLAGNPWVHLAGIGIYSTLFYLGSAHFVFARPSVAPGLKPVCGSAPWR